MFGAILVLLICVSVIYAAISGNMPAVADAALSGCSEAVELCISLAGAMALWGGLMKLAEHSGITKRLCTWFSRPLKKLFNGLDDPAALELISLNVTANMLGLGNAATPIGIKAMKSLDKSKKTQPRHFALFILLNTASIQLVPVTVSALRAQYGSSKPWATAPAALITSICALACGIAAAALIYPLKKIKDQKEKDT